MSEIKPCWFRLRKYVYVCAPPKCAGTSLYRVVFDIGAEVDDRHVRSAAEEILHAKGQRFMTATEVAELTGEKYISVRSPVSRFKSLWRDKCRDLDVSMPELHGLSPDRLMDLIAQNPLGDAHWAPQSVHYCPGAVPVQHKALFVWLDLPPLHVNSSRILLTDPLAPRQRIMKHYADDQKLFAGVE